MYYYMKMYCITIFDHHYNKIEKLGYLPVGLGENILSEKFLVDYNGENISKKNSFYGEYTFHYWLWKNELKNLEKENWIGFCQYRKFWSRYSQKKDYNNLDYLKKDLIHQIPKEYEQFDSILGEPLFVNNFKLAKFFKKNFLKIITNPSLLFDKNKRNIKFHFDLMHGDGNLDKAISLLEINDRKDFDYFVNTEVSFNPHNMFICKTKDILNSYYNTIFPWLRDVKKNLDLIWQVMD